MARQQQQESDPVLESSQTKPKRKGFGRIFSGGGKSKSETHGEDAATDHDESAVDNDDFDQARGQQDGVEPPQQPQEQKTASPLLDDINDNMAAAGEEDDIYDYYARSLLPALWSSLPILLSRLSHDALSYVQALLWRTWAFLLPGLSTSSGDGVGQGGGESGEASTAGFGEVQHSLRSLFDNLLPSGGSSAVESGAADGADGSSGSSNNNNAFADFMLRHFDADHDGHISPSELLRMSDFKIQLPHYPPVTTETTSGWMEYLRGSFSWPFLDWKIGAWLYRTCGGLVLVLAIATVVPGRLHGISGRILRWPILAMTYAMIMVELTLYVLVRLTIKFFESIFANPKHRALRRGMEQATSYNEWYSIARQLDASQNRTQWRRTTNDDTSYRYSWPFIRELIRDLRQARKDDDSLLALAVLQQCTRKNVGGVMSDDLFSYTNAGEPKDIVKEFVDEVVTTVRWVTERANSIPVVTVAAAATADERGEDSKGAENAEDAEAVWLPLTMQRRQEGEGRAAALRNPTQASLNGSVVNGSNNHREQEGYEERLQTKVWQEKTKIYGSLISWATLNFLGGGEADETTKKATSSPSSSPPLVSRAASDPPGGSSSSTGTAPTISSSTLPSPPSSPSLPSQVPAQLQQPHLEAEAQAPPPTDLPAVHREKVKTFLKRARAAYGRTALCLSGGAAMGSYHFGTVKALLEVDALPHIISGTSAGSAIAAMLCTRNDAELARDLKPEVITPKLRFFDRNWPERMKSLWKTGSMFDGGDWYDMIRWFTLGDMTFEEAYRKTGRVFCITLCATAKKAPPVLVNYISAPNVVIASAIVASGAVPGFIPPQRLQVKDSNGVVRNQDKNKDQEYWDGSIEQDIPTSGLAEMLNVQFFLAAQANPHIVPFFYNSKGDVGRPSRWSSGMREDSWRGGFLLSALELYLKSDMRAKFHFLNDLEAAVGFTSTLMTQVYGGTTTIVPQVALQDFFKLFVNPNLSDMYRYFQGGQVAAYQHVAMVKLHYSIAHALDECLAILEQDDTASNKPRRRRSQLFLQQVKEVREHKTMQSTGVEAYSLASPALKLYPNKKSESNGGGQTESSDSSSLCDNEYEEGGFDGVECAYSPKRLSVGPKPISPPSRSA